MDTALLLLAISGIKSFQYPVKVTIKNNSIEWKALVYLQVPYVVYLWRCVLEYTQTLILMQRLSRGHPAVSAIALVSQVYLSQRRQRRLVYSLPTLRYSVSLCSERCAMHISHTNNTITEENGPNEAPQQSVHSPTVQRTPLTKENSGLFLCVIMTQTFFRIYCVFSAVT